MKKINALLTSLLLVCVVVCNVKAQTFELINAEKIVAAKAGDMTNGFGKCLRGDHIPYSNQWDDFQDGIITRATTGKAIIEWFSEPVTKIVDGKAVLLLQVCIDQANDVQDFAFSINDKFVGNLENFHQESCTKQLSDGVQVQFDRIGKISIGDASFFVTVSIPQTMITLNQPVKMKLVGGAEDSNAWMILFCHQNLIEKVKHKANLDKYYQITIDKAAQQISLLSDKYHNGKKLLAKVDNASKSSMFSVKDLAAMASVKAAVKENSQIELSCDNTPILNFELDKLQDTIIVGDDITTVITRTDSNNTTDIVVATRYSTTKRDILRLSKSYAKDARIHIMVSSHQDIAWVDTPYNCVELRDKFVLSPAIELLQKHPDYYYDMEDVLMLEEYITRHPDRTELVKELIKNGQLAIGASYTQPYEEMQSSEALARQLYFGKRWVDKNFEGSNARTYWNVDVPGRTLQMAQILKKSGVNNLQYSRHELGIFNWFSPDSSYVTTFTPGHYTLAAGFLRQAPENGISQFVNYCEAFDDYRSDESKPAVVGMLSAEDMSPAHTYYEWIEKLPTLSQAMDVELPKVQHSTADMFFEDFTNEKPVLEKVEGERPDIWMYIHGPTHQRTLSVYRDATKRATSAETFTTAASLIKNSFEDYPTTQFNQMWKDLIYADHGWGGKGGNVTDSLFDARYKRALATSERINKRATEYIASNIKVAAKQGVPVVVFNQLSVVHSAPVTFEVNVSKYDLAKMVLKNGQGEVVSYQKVSQDGDIATLEFVAENMPSIGYKTFFMTFKGKKESAAISSATESDFYSLYMEDGRLTQVYDKELGAELFDSSKFEVGEVFTMESYGNGAGEFATFQKPEMTGYESTSTNKATWEMVENGAVYALFKSESKFVDADIVRYIKIYKTIKRIDFPVEINNFSGRKYREFRQAFALKAKGDISYDVPFGTVNVGEDEIKQPAGERYLDQPSSIHPRSVTHWMGANDGNVKVNLTSSVVVMDFIDPTDNPIDNSVIQPILLASRKSCHWEGEYYLQKGDHDFVFSLRSDSADSATADLQAMAAAYDMSVVVAPEMYTNATLAQDSSLFTLDTEGVVVSTIKKCEDDNNVILRAYDATSLGGVQVGVESFVPINKIEKTDMLELNAKSVESNNLTVGNRSIETFKLYIK